MPILKTPVDICNMALSAISARLIAGLGEASQEARLCLQWYDVLRQETLEDCQWGFARVDQDLALIGQFTNPSIFPDWAALNGAATVDPLAANAVPKWAYLYKYPSNCVFIRDVYNLRHGIWAEPAESLFHHRNTGDHFAPRFEVLRSRTTNELAVATNLDQAKVRFTYNVTDVSQFTAKFARALSYRLAAELAMPLTANQDIFDRMQSKHELLMGEARRVNLSESPEYQSRSSSYEDVRD